MTEKTVANYTPEMTAKVVEGFKAGRTVEDLATEVGKTVRSVIAKLSKEGVYKSKEKAPAKREMLKSEMVAAISAEIGVSEEVLESLEKATGVALMAVLKALRNE
jgi:molybdopterin converting factor small subunit